MKWYDFLKPRNWSIVKVYRDFENFNDWKKTIRREEANPRSFYNQYQWKLSRTKLFDIYTVISLEDADSLLPETIQRMKLMEMLQPLHKYFDETLGFAECLNCEFNQFEDADKKPTLSYLIVYRFNFATFSLNWLFKFIILIGILSFLMAHFKIIKWLLHLI
jgi:hypothetical protein